MEKAKQNYIIRCQNEIELLTNNYTAENRNYESKLTKAESKAKIARDKKTPRIEFLKAQIAKYSTNG